MGFSSKKEKINGKAFIMIALLLFFVVSGAWADCLGGYTFGSNEIACVDCPSGTGGKWKDFAGKTFYYAVGSRRYCTWIEVARCATDCSQISARAVCCSDECMADSIACIQRGLEWTTIPGGTCNGKGCLEQCDSTYHCESVFTENNVVRSNITLTDCHGNVLQERQVLGSCSENGFCEGDEVSGADSCTYPTPDPDKCRNGGQNGSLCTYVCPDGNLYSCRIAWEPGQPAQYQPCPSKPPANCVFPEPSSSSSLDSLDSLPDPPYTQSSSSVSPEPDPECPECDYLQEIRDTLHRANEQRRYSNYVLDEIKEDVGGFGAQFNSIVSNTAVTVNRLNTSNSSLSAIASTNSQIADKLNSLDLDNITVSVDSIVVNVEGSGDSVVPGASWTFYDLDSLPVWRDTMSQVTRIMKDINSQVDTLVQDSSGENALKKYLPDIRKIYDKVSDFYSGFTLPAVFDTLSSRLGLDTVTVSEAQAIEDKIIPLGDSAYIDGNFYCEEHPDAAVCVELDSSELAGLVGPDTVDANEFFRVQDSILEANRAYLDSLKKRDSIQDTIGLDDLAGDSAKIREKLDFLFLPENTLEQCFDFRLNTTLGKWSYNLFIDFADLFGLDLCDLIRKIVRILTFILIVFTTIKGYIRAFGGGGSGGDV